MTYDCKQIVDRFNLLTKDINVYDINGKCYKAVNYHELKEEDKYETVEVNGKQHKYKKFATYEDYTPWIKNFPGMQKRLKDLPPCTFGEPIIKFLN